MVYGLWFMEEGHLKIPTAHKDQEHSELILSNGFQLLLLGQGDEHYFDDAFWSIIWIYSNSGYSSFSDVVQKNVCVGNILISGKRQKYLLLYI